MNILDIAKIAVSKGLPLIGGAIAGNKGSEIAEELAGILGCPADIASIGSAIQAATPEQTLEMQKYEMDNQVKLKELGVKLEEIHAADRDSARRMKNEETKKNIKDWLRPAVTLLFDLGYIIIVIFVLANPANRQDPVLMLLLGGFTNEVIRMNTFWFGSSKGSQDKTALMGGK